MADTFTDMHQQLNGKVTKSESDAERVRRKIVKYAKHKPNRLEVEIELMDALGIEVEA